MGINETLIVKHNSTFISLFTYAKHSSTSSISSNLWIVYTETQVVGSRGLHSQSTASFLDPKTGVLFYTQINKNGIGCWNSFTHPNEYSPETNFLVASDNETMIFPNDLKVDHEGNLWFLTDKLPNHIYKKLNPEEVNYRIFKGAVKDVVKGTVCEVKDPLTSSEQPTSSTSTSTAKPWGCFINKL